MGKFRVEFKRLRKERNITQEELAHALGVSRSTIGNYEQGIREPDFDMLERIADFFNVNMSVLLDDQSDIEAYLEQRNDKLYDFILRYIRLDAYDKARIDERVNILLEDEKYKDGDLQ